MKKLRLSRALRFVAWSGLLAAVACATATHEDIPQGDGTSASGGGGTSGGKSSGGTGLSAGGTGASGTGGTSAGGTGAKGGATATGGSGATATGGTTGVSGTGTGGTSPFGGAAGMSGGSGGAAGASGAGGSAGTGVTTPTGECAMSPTLALSYKVNQTGDSIAFDLKLTNSGTAPIAANQIEFQYFISQEETSWQEQVLDVYSIQAGTYSDLKTTGTITVDPLTPPLGTQTHLVRIRQSGTAMLPASPSASLQLSARLQPNPSPPNQTQTDDFSYDAGHSAIAAWDHVAVFVDGVLAFGCTPES